MSGLCGFVDLLKTSHDESERCLKRMIRAMRHRGPDYTAVWFTHMMDKTVGLGHCLLATIDSDRASNQPFWSVNRDIVLVYDGKIFNYIEIREQLCHSGVKFRTQSDVEVLLEAYLHWGIDALEKFRGMWAFVLLNLTTGEMICSRDHFGLKPFFYWYDETRFVFASEIKGLLASGKVPIKANTSRVHEFIIYGKVDQGRETFFEGIYTLEPGELLRIDLKVKESILLQRTKGKRMEWKPSFYPSRISHWIQALKEEVTESVKLRARADVPIACSISGGMDSTTVAVILSKTNLELRTFSCIYKNPYKDESKNISSIVSLIKSKHINIIYENNLKGDELIRMLIMQDQPVHTPSIMSQYLIYKEMAYNGIRVAIDGQGGDELFCGYMENLVIYLLLLLMEKQLWDFAREIFFVLYNRQWQIIRSFLRRVFLRKYPSSKSLKELLEKEMWLYTLPHSLRYTDINSMVHSVESRSPFLDQVLYSIARHIPDDLLIRYGKTKFILREMMKGDLPKSIVHSSRKVGLWDSKTIYEMLLLRQYLCKISKELHSNFIDINELTYSLQLNEKNKNWNLIWRQFSVAVWETFVLSCQSFD